MISLKKFDLTKHLSRTQFNYFQYAVLKGLFQVAKEILLQLRKKLSSEQLMHVINEEFKK